MMWRDERLRVVGGMLMCAFVVSVCLTVSRPQASQTTHKLGARGRQQHWITLEQADVEHLSPADVWERQMNTTAQMFRQWGVVNDVRVLPNPDYMHRDESLPRARRGTSVDEVSQRAARSAIADIEQQQREEEHIWAHPDNELVATIVPPPVKGEEHTLDALNDRQEEDPAATERAENLKKIRWLTSARAASRYAAVAQTMTDRAELEQFEADNPGMFPQEIVYPLAEYPDGGPLVLSQDDDDEKDEDDDE
eukprot:CAMPEP_0179424730 /NCGR_PEP_ID=MMETSP0799-20121207/11763_1 /TAXON_ID=46947 /ORGANISM="Geminigera cryophila, Strain CCMP2564" /LENGTH=250 /DNA_ID=CAMNT_0021199239 /DNA_START=1 /DNA_END=753 /DNA_ORIENTATION=+